VAGTCSGCGLTNSRPTVIKAHIAQCLDYAALYQTNSDLCLTPEEEHAKRKEEAADPELRATRREQRLNKIFQQVDTARAFEAARFQTPPDPLADDD
jgi:hypothetical protein